MGVIEDFGKLQQETAQREALRTEVQGPTVQEILANDEESRLFEIYLAQRDDVDLAAKLQARKLGPEDLAALSERRTKFLEIKENAAGLTEKLGDNLDLLTMISPDLKIIANNVGKEGIRKVLIERIDELALGNPEWLDQMNRKLTEVMDSERRIGMGNESIALLCKAHGLNLQEYRAAILRRESDPYALEDLVKSKMGRFKRLFTSDKKFLEKIDDLDRRDSIKGYLNERNQKLSDLMDVAKSTLFSDPATKEHLTRYLVNDNPPEPNESFTESRRISEDYSEKAAEDLQKGWEDIKSKGVSDPDFDIDDAYKSYMKQEAEKYAAKKKGWFAKIFAAVFVQKSIKK